MECLLSRDQIKLHDGDFLLLSLDVKETVFDLDDGPAFLIRFRVSLDLSLVDALTISLVENLYEHI